MAEEMIYIDISDVPDLLRIAEEVRTTRKPRMLRRDNENVAVLMPVTSTQRRKASHYEALYAFRNSSLEMPACVQMVLKVDPLILL